MQNRRSRCGHWLCCMRARQCEHWLAHASSKASIPPTLQHCGTRTDRTLISAIASSSSTSTAFAEVQLCLSLSLKRSANRSHSKTCGQGLVSARLRASPTLTQRPASTSSELEREDAALDNQERRSTLDSGRQERNGTRLTYLPND